MMDPEVKKNWVAALRSGNYKQRTGDLERNGENCCLGVLCRVTNTPEYKRYVGFVYFNFGTESDRSVPPDGFQGLSSHTMNKLWHLNDVDGLTFEEIANYIERNL